MNPAHKIVRHLIDLGSILFMLPAALIASLLTVFLLGCALLVAVAQLMGQGLLASLRSYGRPYVPRRHAEVSKPAGEIPEQRFLYWKCHICRSERRDEFIGVMSFPVTSGPAADMGVTRNVRYCNDNPPCIAEAVRWSRAGVVTRTPTS